MTLSLNIDDQNALYSAFLQMDGKLGSARRSVVKNVAVLKASLEIFQAAHKAVVKEIWPDLPEGKNVMPEEDPENFAKFHAEMKTIIETKEELDLLPLPAAKLYSDDNDFPTKVLVLLDDHGLIEGET